MLLVLLCILCIFYQIYFTYYTYYIYTYKHCLYVMHCFKHFIILSYLMLTKAMLAHLYLSQHTQYIFYKNVWGWSSSTLLEISFCFVGHFFFHRSMAYSMWYQMYLSYFLIFLNESRSHIYNLFQRCSYSCSVYLVALHYFLLYNCNVKPILLNYMCFPE